MDEGLPAEAAGSKVREEAGGGSSRSTGQKVQGLRREAPERSSRFWFHQHLGQQDQQEAQNPQEPADDPEAAGINRKGGPEPAKDSEPVEPEEPAGLAKAP